MRQVCLVGLYTSQDLSSSAYSNLACQENLKVRAWLELVTNLK